MPDSGDSPAAARMHRHLQRQIARATGRDGVLDPEALFASISSYYESLDRERAQSDRSLGLMSDELLALNRQIRAQGEARFRSVFEQAGDALLVADAEDRISRGNPAAAALLGATPEELLGAPVTRFLPAGPREGEAQALRRDGHTVAVEIRRTPLLVEGSTGTLYSLRDISERQRQERERVAFTERLARSNAELERFAYIASHDLQEPLRSVVSFATLLQRRMAPVLDDETREYLQFVIDGSQRMNQMVRGLLELSRLDGAPLQLRPVPLAPLLEELRLELSSAVETAGAQLQLETTATVLADPQQLRRVLLNLLGNALKFRAEAPPRIRVLTQDCGGHWQLQVCDNGIGIDPQHRAEVFQVFRRLHTAEQFPGTGMGLAICERIVGAHGGRIWVEGAGDGGGSRFCLTLQKAS